MTNRIIFLKGRGKSDEVTVATNAVCYFQERTGVIVGVKAELGEPLPSAPQLGRLDFHVDW